jgi:hypothetical protein
LSSIFALETPSSLNQLPLFSLHPPLLWIQTFDGWNLPPAGWASISAGEAFISAIGGTISAVEDSTFAGGNLSSTIGESPVVFKFFI